MLTRLAIVAVLFASGCADEVEYEGWRPGGKDVGKALCPTGCTDGDVVRVLDENPGFDEVDTGVYVTAPGGERSELADVCELLPTDGLCAIACNAAALEAAIAPGTCIDFACALRDGRDLLVGRCVPGAQLTSAAE